MKKEYEDLTGRRFGRWTVVMDGKRKCLCKCDCGAVKKVFRNSLFNGTSKSCGCYKDDLQNKSLEEYGVITPNRELIPEDNVKLRALITDALPNNEHSRRKGVSWVKNKKKWVANISVKGTPYFLGYFDDYEDAVRARELGEQTYWGELIEEGIRENKGMNWLERNRVMLNISKKDLAKQFGIGDNAITNLTTTDSLDNINIKRLKQISDLFGESMDNIYDNWIIKGEKDK